MGILSGLTKSTDHPRRGPKDDVRGFSGSSGILIARIVVYLGPFLGPHFRKARWPKIEVAHS